MINRYYKASTSIINIIKKTLFDSLKNKLLLKQCGHMYNVHMIVECVAMTYYNWI